MKRLLLILAMLLAVAVLATPHNILKQQMIASAGGGGGAWQDVDVPANCTDNSYSLSGAITFAYHLTTGVGGSATQARLWVTNYSSPVGICLALYTGDNGGNLLTYGTNTITANGYVVVTFNSPVSVSPSTVYSIQSQTTSDGPTIPVNPSAGYTRYNTPNSWHIPPDATVASYGSVRFNQNAAGIFVQ